jgi:Tol biopolymer transport system component
VCDLYPGFEGGNLTWIAGISNLDQAQHPWWSPDGSKIVYSSINNGVSEIYVIDSNGAGTQRLTSNSTFDTCPAWSPDGTQIVFRGEGSGFGIIYLINSDGSNPVSITGDTAENYPAWSPDSASIVFTSWRDGNLSSTFLIPAWPR